MATIGRRMPRKGLITGLNVTILGVDFTWSNPGLAYREPVLQGYAKIRQSILEHAEFAIQRQRRNMIQHWDAMTALLRGDIIPARLRETPEHGLAIHLVWAFGENKLTDDLIMEVGSFKPIAHARSRIDFHREHDGGESERRVARMGPLPDVNGRPAKQKPGPYRRLELEMGDLDEDPASIDWNRVILLGVLVQLRTDIEVYLDTGFLSIRRCERQACHAFFKVSRMAGRQRFCSNTCRACDPREH